MSKPKVRPRLLRCDGADNDFFYFSTPSWTRGNQIEHTITIDRHTGIIRCTCEDATYRCKSDLITQPERLPRKTGPKYGSKAFTEAEEDVILWHHTHQNRHVNELAVFCNCSDETIRKALKRASERKQKAAGPTTSQAAKEFEDSKTGSQNAPDAEGNGK